MAAGRDLLVTGVATTVTDGGRPSCTRTTARLQSRRREEEMSRGTVCSPRARVDDRRRTRWTDGAGIVTAVRRTEAKETAPTRRCRAPGRDCSEEEGEETTAETMARTDPFLAAGVDGGVRRRTARSRAWRGRS